MTNTAAASGFQDEKAREREFYTYYDAVRSLSDADFPFTNLFDDEEAKLHKPASSNDTALTAFCQLGALRVGARRCLLFMFDQEYAFILAEATRTLSLRDDHSHDVEDGLWLGQTIIPRGLSVCEHTVNIPAENNGSNRFHDNSDRIHIIDDLKDSRFCDRPYVLEGPKARFYAGVPITSPSGLRIGAYCVLDDKPRNGLRPKDINFMLEMSTTIMEHLEMLRARTEFGRGTRMLTGLGTFVKESPIESSHKRSRRITVPSMVKESPVLGFGESSAATGHQDAHDYFGSAIFDGQVSSNGISSGSSHSTGRQRSLPSAALTDPNDRSGLITPSTTLRAQVSLMDESESDGGVGDTLQRAAVLLRDSIEADGVLILDASIHSYGGAVTGEQYYSDSEPESAISEDGRPTSRPTRIDCRILAQSRRHSNDKNSGSAISEKTLRSLLRHYPQGKVWRFDSNGDISSDESGSDLTSDSADDDNSPTKRQSFKTTRSKRRMREARAIQRVFPGARTICLVSIWDNVREQFYAGAIIFSYSPIRQFSSELLYMMAYMDVVMAKVSRIEANLKDQAKSDFISSVSHELRSPLHGILGSIDFLHDQAVLDWSLISQIERCSATLMDVIDHLLDFAKLNHFGKKLKRIDRRGGAREGNGLLSKSSLASGGSNLTEVVSLAKITEEVTDSIFFSHCCRVDGTPTVEFILDIDMEPDLQCDLAVGAWKRLCINIIGNALKYTTSGYVMVSLRMATPKDKPPLAMLTVCDSGIGMTKEYMESRLFKAFSQENDLANGTGLGMSLVKKILQASGGQIKVQSAKDAGTVMTISMPLDIITPKQAEPMHVVSPGLRVGILQPPRARSYKPTKGRKLQIAALQCIFRRLSAEVVSPEAAAVVVAFEADVQALINRDQADHCTVPVIVLCDTVMSAARLRTSHIKLSSSRRVEFVARPFGPAQICAALQKCIRAAGPQTPITLSPQATAGHTRRVLRRQLSRRAYTQAVVPQSPSKVSQSPLKRSSSAPILAEGVVPTDSFRYKGFGQALQDIAAASENVQPQAGGAELTHHPATTSGMTNQMSNLPIPPYAAAVAEQKLSLLLVDDNPINLRLLTTYAEKYSHPYRGASNGLEAAQAYESAASKFPHATMSNAPKPDVIFLDIQMPIMDGYEAAQRIRAFEKTAGVKPAIIVAITGLASNQSQQDAYSSGIDMFLTKPVRPRDITRVLESISAPGKGTTSESART
ncbi:unnamed protein product [Zymoseptoria tritici ST99CH_1E4]|uniref:histidine kinase n=1 Tax=Zymoseptoria tritici ST99CH_1E4 TaxID=1276532 RepID=A0A2H1GT77_ZYMTR|nr:unnamed protein product [Zymoseptoria tritici ST99CH_1E4]